LKILSSPLAVVVTEGGLVFDNIEFWLIIVIGGIKGFIVYWFIYGDLLFLAMVICGTN